MISITALAAVFALAAAAPTEAPPASTAPLAVSTPSTAAPVVDDGDTVVCKRTEVTGTRFSQKVCHTKTDWANMTRDARDMIDHARSGCGPKGCGN